MSVPLERPSYDEEINKKGAIIDEKVPSYSGHVLTDCVGMQHIIDRRSQS